jgi:hypothetical protein
VNIRHLGYLRRLVNEGVQDIIMIEMIARVVRKQLQEKFRKKTRYAWRLYLIVVRLHHTECLTVIQVRWRSY